MDVVLSCPEYDISFPYSFSPLTTQEEVIADIMDKLDISFEEYYLLNLKIDFIDGCKYCLLDDDIKQSFLLIQESEGLDDAISSLVDFIYYCEGKHDSIDYIKFFEDCGFNNPLLVATMLFCNTAKILPDVKKKIDLLKYKDEYYCGQETERKDIGICCYIHNYLEGLFTSEGYFFHD